MCLNNAPSFRFLTRNAYRTRKILFRGKCNKTIRHTYICTHGYICRRISIMYWMHLTLVLSFVQKFCIQYHINKNDGPLQCKPPPSVFGKCVINRAVSTVRNITCEKSRCRCIQKQCERTKHNFMSFQVGAQKLFRLALPFLRLVSLPHVVVPLEIIQIS